MQLVGYKSNKALAGNAAENIKSLIYSEDHKNK